VDDMQVPEQGDIRRAFVNTSRSRAASMTLPGAWPPPRSDERDFLGWVDPKAPRRAYLVVGPEVGDELVATELRLPSAPGGRARKTMCDLCHSVDAPDGAARVVAPRAGARGRAGDSVGICVCLDFDCSLRVREPLKEHQVSVSGRPDDRQTQLVERLRDFLARIRT
jgi:hypothetical protein